MAIDIASRTQAGQLGNGNTGYLSLSGSGQVVAFASEATDLVAGDTNTVTDVFLKNLATGALTRVSVAADGTQANDGSSTDSAPSLSRDGTVVAFASDASNLVTGDTNATTDIFVKNTVTGAIVRASTASNGTEATGRSNMPSLSADGTKVVFESNAPNLVPGVTGNQIYLKNLVTGVTSLVSSNSLGAPGSNDSRYPVISADGTSVVFTSLADNLVPGDGNAAADIFVKNLLTGTTTRVSLRDNGTEALVGTNAPASISADGKVVVFVGTGLVASEQVPLFEGLKIYARNLATNVLTLVSEDVAGQPLRLADGVDVSADGTKVTFIASLNPGDAGVIGFGSFGVYRKDLTSGAFAQIDLTPQGQAPNATARYDILRWGTMSDDGAKVAFTTLASNLVPGDANAAYDAYVWSGAATTVAPLVSTYPAAALTQFITGSNPTASQMTLRTQAATDAYNYYANVLKVANPNLGPYESLGVSFSYLPEFQSKYGTAAIADNGAFVAKAYQDVFLRAPTAGQQSAFTGQISYFTGLYQSTGVSATTALQQARGAVVGQMIGYVMTDPSEASRPGQLIDDKAIAFADSVKASLVGVAPDIWVG